MLGKVIPAPPDQIHLRYRVTFQTFFVQTRLGGYSGKNPRFFRPVDIPNKQKFSSINNYMKQNNYNMKELSGAH
jgi:hypothetical protein